VCMRVLVSAEQGVAAWEPYSGPVRVDSDTDIAVGLVLA
jgi:hypothetical protein